MVLFTVPGTLWGVVGDVRHFRTWVAADLFLGIGTALVYPALQAGAADEVEPMHRGLALGTYRFIRDIGYVVGAVVCGHLTDDIGYEGTFLVNAAVLGAALLCVIIFYHPNEPEELIEVVLPDEESRLITKKSLIGSPRGSTGREDGKIYAIPKTVRILVPQYSDSF